MSAPAAIASSQNVTIPAIPELYDANFLDRLVPVSNYEGTEISSNTPKPTNPFMEALKSSSHQVYTTNNARAYDTTSSATLDAFHMLRPFTSGSDIYRCLGKAWEEDPEMTLRMIWNLRSIHDGKGEKELFYQAWGWLYKNHPRTALDNLPQLVKPVCRIGKRKEEVQLAPHGYWKDLLNILCLAALDQLGPLNEPATFLHCFTPAQLHNRYYERKSKMKKPVVDTEATETEARRKREEKNVRLHNNLIVKLAEPKFRALYILVARLFAEKLAGDIGTLDRVDALPTGQERNEFVRRLSLVSKWAPTPGLSHDRHSNISSAIAQLLHYSHSLGPSRISLVPEQGLPSLETHILRSYYRRWILTPLREAIAVPESLMSANRWKEIIYSRVASQCMKNNMIRFYAYDPEGFEKYMSRVESGSRTISGATLMPHELVTDAISAYRASLHIPHPKKPSLKDMKKRQADMQLRVVEAQWRTMLDRVKEAGKLDNALAICDVSGSMGSITMSRSGDYVQPIAPAVALSLVLAQIAQPPFDNSFITFSSHPQFVQIDPSWSLGETIDKISQADWGMNTNYEAVFLKLLLPLAIQHNIKPDDMIKRLFVFSDMQFDESCPSTAGYVREPEDAQIIWDTNHDVIEKAYKEAGYEVPQIVYWNLGYGASTTPVAYDRQGVAIMNGFSPSVLKVFMGEEENDDQETGEEWEKVDQDGESETIVEKTIKEEVEFTPYSVMKKALSKASYDGLVVVD
ncbi:hypothetical protein QCA50_004915 [Cerrena zonata]|uniref:Uncharacterized protein n=1 Tax=Cerrena zonata TaxID=2478898 RepID=A0AAW0GPT6_9APHY